MSASASGQRIVAARSSAASVGGLHEDATVLIPAGLVLAVVIAWAAAGGGYESRPALDISYDPSPWFLGALALVGLLCATAFGLRRVWLSRPLAIACALLGAYVAWSFASVFWAHDKGSAFLGSDRALVYLAGFTTFAILPWRARTLAIALAALTAGFGVIALVTAVKIGTATAPADLYIGGRLAYPLGYENASAALFMLTAMTSVGLCAARRVPAALRVGGLLLAAICLQLDVLTQSRGWLFTAPVVVTLMLVVQARRLRLILFALAPALAAAAATPALLKVYSSASARGPLTRGQLEQLLHTRGAHAAHAMLLADIALAVVATAMVLVDRRMRLSEHQQRRVTRVAGALGCAAALAGVIIALVAVHGDVTGRAERAWDSFASVKVTHSSSSRFASLGSQRADFWRVALSQFERHPLQGIGQDNFADPYIQQRRTDQEPRWTHSLELRLLTHTGLVGLLLFGGFLAAALTGALRHGRRHPAIGAVALTPLIVWLVHGSIDWLWEFPALSVPALAFIAAAGALAAAPRPATERPRRAPSKRMAVALRVTVALVTVAALVAIGVAFMAARDVQKALGEPEGKGASAYVELRRAADLMPFNAQTDLIAGSLAFNEGYLAIARRWFVQARENDPYGWLAPFALGLIEGEARDARAARALLLAARRLNPHEPVIGEALKRVASASPLTLEQAQQTLTTRATRRFGR